MPCGKHNRRVTTIFVAAVIAATLAAPAQAQFEVRDTLPRLGFGPFLELTFRGSRGVTFQDNNYQFQNGPVFGLGLEYRTGRTVVLGLAASDGATREQVSSGRPRSGELLLGEFDVYRFLGNITFKLKPNVPGYFRLEGGIRYVVPAEFDPQDPTTQRWSRSDPYPEATVGFHAGLEFKIVRQSAMRVDFGWNWTVVKEMGPFIEEKGLASDFALRFWFLYRPS